jgi:hypothetical protein
VSEVAEGNNVTSSGVRSNAVEVDSGVEVFAFNPISVGVEVKVGVGAVGVNVGESVGVFVNVGAVVGVGGAPRIWSTVVEQAESNKAKTKITEIFFIWRMSSK